MDREQMISTPLHLLILEDRPADAELMLHELRQAGFEPDWQRVETEADYVAQLHQGLDVILADYVLPQFDALRALHLLQERDLDIPFIIISGRISEEVAVECMKQGAADYLLKDRLARLGSAVTHALQDKKLRDEKRQTEAALRESEARFRRLAENAADIIYRYRLTPTLGFEYLSPAVTAITGYTPEEYYADPDLWRGVAHADDRRAMEQLLLTGQIPSRPFVVRVVRKDGAIIWTEQRSVPIYDEAGNLVAIEGVTRDITERKRAEEALRVSEEKYRSLSNDVLGRTAVGIFILDSDFGVVWVNQALEHYFGLQRKKVIGWDKRQLIRERIKDIFEDPERFARTVLATYDNNTHIEGFECHVLSSDERKERWLEHRSQPIRSGLYTGGRVELYYDITERKRAEEALKESLERIEQAKQEWESTADSLPSIVCLFDHRGHIIRANRTVEDWNLGSVAEVKGRRLHEFLHPGCTDPACYLETFWPQAWKGLAQGRPAECEAEDGVLKRHLSVQIRPISAQTDREGKKTDSFAIAVVQDITERKRAEEQIQRSLEEKEVLLKEIHHRVKNNLQIISSLLKLQSEYIQNEQTLEMFKESQNRVRSMALVHEKLYQSRDLARIDFAEYIGNLATYLFRSHGVNLDAITLKVNVDDVSLGIDTAIPCGLIINELVSNSLRHAFPAGEAHGERSESKGEISIELCSGEEGRLTLIVGDNGVGLPPDLDFCNTESLGLQLVNMLTRQLEGSIELDRSDGTTFKITFAEPESET